jgi:hypothetical protein
MMKMMLAAAGDDPRRQAPARILRFAIFESGAIFGLILSFMTHTVSYSVYFGVPAILLLAILG